MSGSTPWPRPGGSRKRAWRTTGENNLLELIAADPIFGMTKEDILRILEPANFVGRSGKQVEEFVSETVQPILDKYADDLGVQVEINV